MIEVKVIENPQEWEAFVLAQPYTLFVQSPRYGEFYQTLGEQYWIFGIYENEKLVGGSLVVSTHAKRGNFLYIPYGPIFTSWTGEYLSVWSSTIRDFAKKEGYQFVRVSPFIDDTPEHRQLFRNHGLRPAPMHVLAETTWLLNLEETEDELLARMNKNHRNLIRRCLKENVRIEQSVSADDLATFNNLLDITTKRHKFFRFSPKYIQAEFSAFSPDHARLLTGYLPSGTVDASAIFVYYGSMACYRHGASAGLDKHLPSSYLLQWEAIREAKRRGMKWYNFWGIAPVGAPQSHPFFGITHFKKGFGGVQKDLLHCQDMVISPLYWLTWMVESARRLKRGF